MALNFPNSPVDGEIYEQFYWDATAGIWRNRQIVAVLDNLADVDASSPNEGDIIIYDSGDEEWKASPQPEIPSPFSTVFLLMGA
jgi:hypothetical protein